jgi:hypothetical protein
VRLALWVESFAPEDILAALSSSFRNALPEVDLKKRTHRVERNFTIQLEKYREDAAAKATVEIGRN